MKLETKIKPIEAEINENKLVLKSKTPMKTLSSAVLNGGMRDANYIISVQVPEDVGSDIDDEVHREAGDFLREETTKLDLPPNQVVGIMTAAKMKNIEVKSQKLGDTTVTALVTAGVHFAATAGDNVASEQGAFSSKRWGTINIIVLIDGNLAENCMANALMTTTEAKAAALRELDVRSRFSGDAATGTVTDSIVIACTNRGAPIKYAGTGTAMGELIGKSVKEAVKKAIGNQESIVSNRPITWRLEDRGITIENVTTLFSQIRPILRENPEKRKQFTKKLEQVLSDQNIAGLVIAGFRLDEDANAGLIPENPSKEHTRNFVLSKLLQKAVMDYFGKEKAQHRFLRSDYLSSTFTCRMGVFSKSVLSAVMYSVYSNVVAD